MLIAVIIQGQNDTSKRTKKTSKKRVTETGPEPEAVEW